MSRGFAADEQLVTDYNNARRDFLQFHKANELLVEKVVPGWFGEALVRKI